MKKRITSAVEIMYIHFGKPSWLRRKWMRLGTRFEIIKYWIFGE